MAKTKTDTASETKVKIAARRLITRDDRPGIKAIKIAPTTGIKIIVVRYGKSNYTDSYRDYLSNPPPLSPSLYKRGGIGYVREASPLFDSPFNF